MTTEPSRRPGRPNKGAAHIDQVDSDPVTKARAKAILATISGELTVAQACEAIGVSKTRFEMLRSQMLEAAVQGLQPGKPGRPRTRPSVESDGRVKELSAKVASLERDLHRSELALEISEILPRVVADMAADAATRRSKGAEKGGRASRRKGGRKT